ncbi:MAG: ketol-acid reductoisomerase, partial [Bacteroidetes bacterium]|nr:ketol-acid reductoisomerase [Bacteroidota bacterium]
NGMDWMYANCSTTAQRGALDWRHKFREAVEPVFDDLYDSVASGREAEIAIKKGQDPDYRKKLDEELKELRDSEIWQTGTQVRKLRP